MEPHELENIQKRRGEWPVPYTPENVEQNQGFEQYKEIERGDLQPTPQFDDGSSQQTTSTQPINNQTDPAPTRVDPLEVLKSLISSGFTPTASQIKHSTQDLNGSNDSSNTWFALFLQKLVKQKKHRDKSKQ